MKRALLSIALLLSALAGAFAYHYGQYELVLNPYARDALTGRTNDAFLPEVMILGEYGHYAIVKDTNHEYNVKLTPGVTIMRFMNFCAVYDASFEMVTDTRTSFWFNPRTIFFGHEFFLSYLLDNVHVFDAAYHHICRHEVDMSQQRSRIVDNLAFRYRTLPLRVWSWDFLSVLAAPIAANELILYSDWAYGYRNLTHLGLWAALDTPWAQWYATATVTLIAKAVNYVPGESTLMDMPREGGYQLYTDFYAETGLKLKGFGAGLSFFLRYEYLSDAMITFSLRSASLVSIGLKAN